MNQRQLKLTDYDGFVEKFKPKKTTDDCYTPQAVFEAVTEYVDKFVTPLAGREVVRPFWPGGDYQSRDYPPGCIVIDNPPFSILAEILRFYAANKIDFFLFANGLTLMNSKHPTLAYRIINHQVVFENGAIVYIGFVTNVKRGDEKIVLAGWLDNRIRQDNKKKTRKLKYPPEIQSAALMKKYVCEGVNMEIPEQACHPLAKGDEPFGGGFIVAAPVMEQLERARERLTVHRRMSPACNEMIRRINEANADTKITVSR